MTTYEALDCLCAENADPDAVRQARALVRAFLDKILEIKNGLENLKQQPIDTYPLLSAVLAEEGLCLIVFGTAADIREALAQKGFGDFARKLPNDRIVNAFIDTVRARDAELPMAFEERRRSLIWDTAQRLIQEAASDWPEVTERTVRIVRKRRDDT